jgi:adenylate kinase
LYHEKNDPPKKPGVCDVDQGELYQREDDRPEVVLSRLEKQKPPTALIDHYRAAGVLKEVDGEQSLDRVTELLMEAIQ